MNLLVLGDSITYGAWDVECDWVVRLRRRLEIGSYNHYVFNRGIAGDTSSKGYALLAEITGEALNNKGWLV